MPISAAERRLVMAQLGQRAQQEIARLWDAAARFDDIDFAVFVADEFPDIANAAHQLAAEVSATFFEEDFPDLVATAAAAPPAEQWRSSAQWALGGDGVQGLQRLQSTLQRAVFDGDRQTTVQNAYSNGMRWVRVARPNACAFCRMLASRSTLSDDLYRSEEAALRVVGRSVNLSDADRRMIASGQMTRDQALARRDEMQLTYQIGRRKGSPRGRRLRGARQYGEKYHDDCYCTAKAIPSGADPIEILYQDEPEFAFLAEQWNNEYIKARSAAESGDPKKILSQWRQLDVGAG